MDWVLIMLASAGLLGCFGATIGIDLANRKSRSTRRLARPRTLSIRYE